MRAAKFLFLLFVIIAAVVLLARLRTADSMEGAHAPNRLEPRVTPPALAQEAVLADPPRAPVSTEVPAALPNQDASRSDAPSPVEPWKKLRLDEIDRELAELEADRDVKNRFNELTSVLGVCLAPLLDEQGFSTPLASDNLVRKVARRPGEHYMTSNNRSYMWPRGLYPVYDQFIDVWQERVKLEAALPPEQQARGLPDPFPLDETFLADVRALAKEAKAAVARREEAY